MVQRYGFFLNSQIFFNFFTLLADRSRGVCIFYFDLRSGSGADLVVVALVLVFRPASGFGSRSGACVPALAASCTILLTSAK